MFFKGKGRQCAFCNSEVGRFYFRGMYAGEVCKAVLLGAHGDEYLRYRAKYGMTHGGMEGVMTPTQFVETNYEISGNLNEEGGKSR